MVQPTACLQLVNRFSATMHHPRRKGPVERRTQIVDAQDMVRTGFSAPLEHFAAYAGSGAIAMAGFGLNRGAVRVNRLPACFAEGGTAEHG
jgi:hypothetical protein